MVAISLGVAVTGALGERAFAADAPTGAGAGAAAGARRFALAGLVPKIRIGFAVHRSVTFDRRSLALDGWAALSWPLDGLSAADARARLQASAKGRAADDDRALRIEEAWRRRELLLRALETAEDVEAAQLDAEEAAAQLDAVRDGEAGTTR